MEPRRVPFLLVKLPTELRLYAGFTYQMPTDASATPEQRGVLETATPDEVSKKPRVPRCAIDDGTLWSVWGKRIDPKARVDWKLLGNLRSLAEKLQEQELDPHVAHALIGKYIYLRYLDERALLKPKLAEWKLAYNHIFGREATVEALRELTDNIERHWLNGSDFPIPFDTDTAPTTEHVRQVASVLLGDDAETTTQLHFDFKAYDFCAFQSKLCRSSMKISLNLRAALVRAAHITPPFHW